MISLIKLSEDDTETSHMLFHLLQVDVLKPRASVKRMYQPSRFCVGLLQQKENEA